jgi:hypothetical protein
VSVPDRRPVDPPAEGSDCRFAVAPDGRLGAEGQTWAREEPATAFESEGSISVTVSPQNGYSFLGSAPAFRSDGLLTYVDGGMVRALDIPCPSVSEPSHVGPDVIRGCSHVAIPRGELWDAARRHPNVPEDAPGYLRAVRVESLAWLDENRAVAVLRLRIRFVGRYEVVALIDGGRLHDTVSMFSDVVDLQTSVDGRYFGLREANSGDVLLFDRDGRSVEVPPLTMPHAFTFSPDSRWLAVATRASVYFFALDHARVFQVGITAADVGWIAG